MGGSKKPATPTAQEMMQAEADWNRINQFSPYGSTVFSDDGRTATNTFSPEMQRQFDLQMGVGNTALAELLGFAQDPSKFNFGNQDILNQFMDPSGVWSGGAGSYGSFGGGAAVPGFEGLQDMITYSGAGGDANIGPGYEGNLNFAGIESFLPEQGDLLAARDRSERAMFDRMMGLTDPVFERRKAQEAEMLANRGIGEGSEIWGTYGQQYGEDYGRALTAAQQDAISEGRAETESLWGMGMETGKQALSDRLAEIATQNQKQQMIEQANLAARGQEWNERYGQGALAQQAAATSTQAAGNRARTMQGDRQFDAQMALQAAIQQWQQQMAGYQNIASLAGYGAQGTPGMGYAPGSVNTGQAYAQDLQNRQFDFQTSPWAMGMDLVGTLGGAALSNAALFSSVTYKTDFEEVDAEEILTKVNSLKIPRWNYIGELNGTKKHIGPMAEEFSKEFGTPMQFEDGSIGLDAVSVMGVALKAIQALTSKVAELEQQIAGGE